MPCAESILIREKMALVCLTVYLREKMVIPWTIINIDDPGLTFLKLHQKLCAGSLTLMLERFAGTLQQSQLVSACVGATKDNLTSVDINLPIDEVCQKTTIVMIPWKNYTILQVLNLSVFIVLLRMLMTVMALIQNAPTVLKNQQLKRDPNFIFMLL